TLSSHDRLIGKNPDFVSRRLVPTLILLAFLVVPAMGSAATTPPKEVGPADAALKIEGGHLKGGKAPIYGTVPVTGTLAPFVSGQQVEVTFYLDGHKLLSRQVAVQKSKGDTGGFQA